jgi:hypothetical protein
MLPHQHTIVPEAKSTSTHASGTCAPLMMRQTQNTSQRGPPMSTTNSCIFVYNQHDRFLHSLRKNSSTGVGARRYRKGNMQIIVSKAVLVPSIVMIMRSQNQRSFKTFPASSRQTRHLQTHRRSHHHLKTYP